MNLSTNNPASDMDSSDSEAIMAAAMGFSGFGKAPATKKRKYNSKTDAFIDGQELQNIDRGGKKGQGSGGNEVPLGKMRVIGAPNALAQKPHWTERNEEDIALDMEDRVDEEDRPMEERCLDTSRPPPVEEQERIKARRAARRGKPMVNEDEIMLDSDDEDEAAISIQPTPTIDTTAAQQAQCKIDTIHAASAGDQPAASLHEAADTPARKPMQKQKQKQKPAQGLASFMAALQIPVLPPPSVRPPPGPIPSASPIPLAPGAADTMHTNIIPTFTPGLQVHSSANLQLKGDSRAKPRGQRNELWYVDYYDPSFNENPWRQLEKELGLPSVGTWLERSPRNHHQSTF